MTTVTQFQMVKWKQTLMWMVPTNFVLYGSPVTAWPRNKPALVGRQVYLWKWSTSTCQNKRPLSPAIKVPATSALIPGSPSNLLIIILLSMQLPTEKEYDGQRNEYLSHLIIISLTENGIKTLAFSTSPLYAV